MITLYGAGESRSFRALWALEEAGLEYTYAPVQFGSDVGPTGTGSNEYRSLNSQGKVPTLLEGDLILTESGAILNYLASKNPAAGLLPDSSARERARYDELCLFVLTDLEQPLWSNGKHRFALPAEQRIESMLPLSHWEFAKSLRALGRHMENCEYAVADRFTCADILVAQTLRWAERFGFELPPEFAAYKNRQYARPACLKALAIIS